MNPSEVDLCWGFPPLTDTYGRVELEAAATLIVFACQCAGESFTPQRAVDIKAAIDLALELKLEPLYGLRNNPFWKPNFNGLVENGFARWTTDAEHSPIELTELGLLRLEKYRNADGGRG